MWFLYSVLLLQRQNKTLAQKRMKESNSTLIWCDVFFPFSFPQCLHPPIIYDSSNASLLMRHIFDIWPPFRNLKRSDVVLKGNINYLYVLFRSLSRTVSISKLLLHKLVSSQLLFMRTSHANLLFRIRTVYLLFKINITDRY